MRSSKEEERVSIMKFVVIEDDGSINIKIEGNDQEHKEPKSMEEDPTKDEQPDDMDDEDENEEP